MDESDQYLVGGNQKPFNSTIVWDVNKAHPSDYYPTLLSLLGIFIKCNFMGYSVHFFRVSWTRDDTIPYDESSAFGVGPNDSLISWDGYYYERKSSVLDNW